MRTFEKNSKKIVVHVYENKINIMYALMDLYKQRKELI